jgi:hypothetical protein
LGPDALKAVTQAFDAAWAEIAPRFHDQTQIESARLSLASAILSIASDDSRDVEVLKRAGLQALARDYTLPFAVKIE